MLSRVGGRFGAGPVTGDFGTRSDDHIRQCVTRTSSPRNTSFACFGRLIVTAVTTSLCRFDVTRIIIKVSRRLWIF